MANAFGIIAALVLGAAAFFGYKNKIALADQRAIVSDQQDKLLLNEDNFREKQEDLAGLQEDTKAATEEKAELDEKLEAKLASNKTMESDIEDKKGDVKSKTERVESGKEKLAKFGELDGLEENLKQLGTDLATLKGEDLALTGQIDQRRSASAQLRTENAALEGVLGNYARKQSLPGLNASVSRVVSDFDFVILTGGDNAGVIKDSTLDVLRNGEKIGKLKVTATLPSSAAASMIPDSFTEGSRVRVGDKVVASN